MATSARCKLNALLDFAMRLKHVEDGQMVQIVAVRLDEVEEFFFEDLDLLCLDNCLLAGILLIQLETLFLDAVGLDGCNL